MSAPTRSMADVRAMIRDIRREMNEKLDLIEARLRRRSPSRRGGQAMTRKELIAALEWLFVAAEAQRRYTSRDTRVHTVTHNNETRDVDAIFEAARAALKARGEG